MIKILSTKTRTITLLNYITRSINFNLNIKIYHIITYKDVRHDQSSCILFLVIFFFFFKDIFMHVKCNVVPNCIQFTVLLIIQKLMLTFTYFVFYCKFNLLKYDGMLIIKYKQQPITEETNKKYLAQSLHIIYLNSNSKISYKYIYINKTQVRINYISILNKNISNSYTITLFNTEASFEKIPITRVIRVITYTSYNYQID
ncbi:hypothetical protein AGLY_009200 [Aphis glycines]|uniref:Transmembrane protein n=1 Tax=Aphis glycines TaxID=307491 RepID=A0A6G0TIS8_APHGL|nr:hypothetical protein AGLY_009200 [Aphis glycines]